MKLGYEPGVRLGLTIASLGYGTFVPVPVSAWPRGGWGGTVLWVRTTAAPGVARCRRASGQWWIDARNRVLTGVRSRSASRDRGAPL